MKTSTKQPLTHTPFIALAACLFFAVNPTWAATFAEETQGLITQQMTARIDDNMQKMLADQTIFQKMQQGMMSMTSEIIKKNTAERKRATVVETCMECRTAKPLKVQITGRTTVLDADTQTIINQKMATMVQDTIRKNSSDPVVARSVQEKMMSERMPKSILRAKMQPYMMGAIFDSTGGSLAEKKGADSVAQIVRDTPLVTMQKN